MWRVRGALLSMIFFTFIVDKSKLYIKEIFELLGSHFMKNIFWCFLKVQKILKVAEKQPKGIESLSQTRIF